MKDGGGQLELTPAVPSFPSLCSTHLDASLGLRRQIILGRQLLVGVDLLGVVRLVGRGLRMLPEKDRKKERSAPLSPPFPSSLLSPPPSRVDSQVLSQA